MAEFSDEPPEELAGDEPIEMEMGDTLDLHFFAPRDVKDLVRDYLDLAFEKGLRELRIIHGKGTGVQRRMVRSILDKDPRVVRYGDPPDASGWGATRVELAAPSEGDD